jgi:hypothetical protein
VTKRFLLAALALLVATAALAAELPPAKRWHNPEVVQRLGLSEDQQNRLEVIFRSSANELIDLRGAVEKESIALKSELDRPQLDRQGIRRAAARLSEARAHLFERELMMLADMRGVLTDAQWSRMRELLDRPNVRPQVVPRPNMRRQQQQ